MTTIPNTESLARLVEANRVHRSVYTDPAIFELEMERIWGQAWIYIGHDSQVPEPGDYITTELGLDPVIMVRGDDNRIRVLVNRVRSHDQARFGRHYVEDARRRRAGGMRVRIARAAALFITRRGVRRQLASAGADRVLSGACAARRSR